MRIVIHGKPPSVNSLYRRDPRDGHLYINKRGRNYKKVVSDMFKELAVKLPVHLRGIPLKITYVFYFRQLWDGKSPVQRDADGPVKCVQDAVTEALKVNDAWIFRGIFEKRRGDERAVIFIEPYVDEGDEFYMESSPNASSSSSSSDGA